MEKILTNEEVFWYLMRKLNNIAIQLPRKESEKILYIINQIENLHNFPFDIRMESNYIGYPHE